MARRRSWAVVVPLVVIVLAVVAGAAPAGADTAPLSTSDTILVISPDGTGSIVVSNDSGADISVTTSVMTKDGGDYEPLTAGGLDAIPAGRAGTVTVRLDGSVEPADLPAGLTLVVTAPVQPGFASGAALRVPIATHEKVTPRVTTWELGSAWPSDDLTGASLPLTGPCSDLGLKGEGASRIGTLQASGRALPVYGRCDSANPSALALNVENLDWNGRSYAGDLKIADGEKVTTTLKQTTAWWIVALLLLVGSAAAVVVTRWTGFRRKASDEKRRTYIIEHLVDPKNPDSADSQFQAIAANLGDVSTWSIRKAVRAEARTLRSKLVTATSDDAVTAVATEIDALETRVRDWPKTANLLVQLRARSAALAKVPGYRCKVLEHTFERDDVSNGDLTWSAASDVTAVATEAVDLVHEIPVVALGMAQDLINDHPGLPAAANLEVVIGQQLAGNPDDAESNSAAQVREALEAFWPAYRALVTAAAEERAAAVAPREVRANLAAAAGPGTQPFVPEPVVDPLDEARRLATATYTYDVLAFGVLLLVALAGGMAALYVGKTFGGWADYAAALAWGAGSAAVTGTLAAAAANLAASAGSRSEGPAT